MTSSTVVPRPAESAPDRLASIDALRGLAFLSVLLVHTAQCIPSFPGKEIATTGAYGVSLFFIASAFTLYASHRQRAAQGIAQLRAFFIRRIFRIVPLFWAGILFYYLIDGTYARGWAEGPLTWFHFGLTATLLHGWHPDTVNSVVPGGWSIAAEFGFYALAPLLFLVLTTWRRTLLAYAVAVALALGLNSLARSGFTATLYPETPSWRQASFTWLWLPTHLPSFLLGFLVWHLREQIAGLSAAMRNALASVAVGAVLAPMLLVRGISADYVFPVVLAFFVLALLVRPLPLFVNRFTCFLGTLSFSAYITHFAALRVVEKILLRLQLQISPAFAFALMFAAALVITVAASFITYHMIEKPGIALGRRLIRASRPAPAPVPA